jgi:pyruvate dehydrogenase kinase 2/3/4
MFTKIIKRTISTTPAFYSSGGINFTNIYTGIHLASKKPETKVTIPELVQHGRSNRKHYISSQFLYDELPVRLANRIKDLDRLPNSLTKNAHVDTIRDWYIQSFYEITIRNKPHTREEIDEFHTVLHGIYDRHSTTMITMAKAINDIKKKQVKRGEDPIIDYDITQQFLDRFYKSRIGIRVLLGHFLELFQDGDGNGNDVGVVCLNTNVEKILTDVVNDVSFVCDRNDYLMPDVQINGVTGIELMYIPTHLYYVLFEIVKNAVKATNDIGENHNGHVSIDCFADNNWVILRVSDNGIGIKKHNLDAVWNYFYTTSQSEIDIDEFLDEDFGTSTPLSGLGYGLPISRLYTRYFGGDLKICSRYGGQDSGTDVYLVLKKEHL